MKVLILFVVIAFIIGCVTTQPLKQDSQSETTLTNNSNKDYGKTPRFADPEILAYPIKQVLPTYPSSARNAGIEGEVWLQVEIFADGSVGAIEVIKSLMPGQGGLDEVAVQVVRKWIFEPAMSAESPVACWITFPVEFRLK